MTIELIKNDITTFTQMPAKLVKTWNPANTGINEFYDIIPINSSSSAGAGEFQNTPPVTIGAQNAVI
jgi:hypothetical protein